MSLKILIKHHLLNAYHDECHTAISITIKLARASPRKAVPAGWYTSDLYANQDGPCSPLIHNSLTLLPSFTPKEFRHISKFSKKKWNSKNLNETPYTRSLPGWVSYSEQPVAETYPSVSAKASLDSHQFHHPEVYHVARNLRWIHWSTDLPINTITNFRTNKKIRANWSPRNHYLLTTNEYSSQRVYRTQWQTRWKLF